MFLIFNPPISRFVVYRFSFDFVWLSNAKKSIHLVLIIFEKPFNSRCQLQEKISKLGNKYLLMSHYHITSIFVLKNILSPTVAPCSITTDPQLKTPAQNKILFSGSIFKYCTFSQKTPNWFQAPMRYTVHMFNDNIKVNCSFVREQSLGAIYIYPHNSTK